LRLLLSRRSATGLLVPIAMLLATGCQNPFASGRTVKLFVEDINAPAEVLPGAPINITLTVVTGGCRSFERLDAKRSERQIVITAVGRDRGGKNISCPTNVEYEPHDYVISGPLAFPFVVVVLQPNGTGNQRVVNVRQPGS